MRPISGTICEVCGEHIAVPAAEAQPQLCSPCQQDRPHFAKAAAFGAYDRELRDLIHLLKYERIEPAARILGLMLGVAIQKLDLPADSVLVVPVPLHGSKKRDRGFNQAELIARSVLKQAELPGAVLATDLLERIRPTVSQIGLTRPQRAENIRAAFRVKHLTKVAGRKVLLVDDVLTTGTTANECARILRKAGAEKVWVATVARTLKENTAYPGADSATDNWESAKIGAAS